MSDEIVRALNSNPGEVIFRPPQRPIQEIKTEYQQLAFRVGALTYQIKADQEIIDGMMKQMSKLNEQATEIEKAQAEKKSEEEVKKDGE